MNLFNTYQALGFWAAIPFGAQWLSENGHNAWAIVAGLVWLVGFFIAGTFIHEGAK